MSAGSDAWRGDWDLDGCVRYIKERGYSRVTLQFPDELQAYVLADTTYQSTGVDEVAALHVDAHCVIHYGRASLSALSRLPAYFVFGRAAADPAALAERLASHARSLQDAPALVVLLDQPLLWAVPELCRRLAGQAALDPEFSSAGGAAIVLAEAAARHLEPGAGGAGTPDCTFCASGRVTAAGYTWELPAGVQAGGCAWAWVGDGGAPALAQLQLAAAGACWATLDALGQGLRKGLPPELERALRRRRFLVEKARAASIVGIVVGTLGVAGYRVAVEAVRALARRAGKRTYTLLVGKPSPAKLANFPEVEVFVLVADPQGHILDSKEFLAPIITPAEALEAFSPGAPPADAYSAEFGAVLTAAARMAASNPDPDSDGEAAPSLALAVRPGAALANGASAGALAPVGTAAEYLAQRRTWRGLETPLAGAEVLPAGLALPGRIGRAAGYADEPAVR
ncbi:hypothetical protein WJX81_007441 [Elliptochloris bilobata]|uniref:Diphthamide biosynthesis protein 2 n=1 Tax=Elliptochloris bilobata TaxID=381761 RepID=A0AAW1QI16_9CHLO